MRAQTKNRVGFLRILVQRDGFTLLVVQKFVYWDHPIELRPLCSCGDTETFFATHVLLNFHVSEPFISSFRGCLMCSGVDAFTGDVIQAQQEHLLWIAHVEGGEPPTIPDVFRNNKFHHSFHIFGVLQVPGWRYSGCTSNKMNNS